MRIETHDRDSGNRFSGEAAGLDESFISRSLNMFDVSDQDLQRWIDRLPLSADAKRILFEISRKTIIAGEIVIRIGRKIVETALFLVRKFPMTTAGLVIGSLLGALVAGIPIIGVLLGPIVKPFAMAAGLAFGALQDIRDAALKSAVQESLAGYEELRTV